METRANHVLVGSIVLVLVIGLGIFVAWMGRELESDQPARYLTYFTSNVTGLDVGSAVRYRGVPVGRVATIDIDPDNIARVRVVLGINRNLHVPADATAQINYQGITGLRYVQITGGSQDAERLPQTTEPPYPEIRARSAGVEEILEAAPEMLERANALLGRLHAILSAENVERIGRILADVETVTDAVAAHKDEVVVALRETTTLARRATEAAKIMVKVLGAAANDLHKARDLMIHADQLLAELGPAILDTVTTYNQVGRTANGLIRDLRPGMTEFGSVGLYEIQRLIVDAQSLVRNLNAIAAGIKRDPRQFLLGPEGGFEIR